MIQLPEGFGLSVAPVPPGLRVSCHQWSAATAWARPLQSLQESMLKHVGFSLKIRDFLSYVHIDRDTAYESWHFRVPYCQTTTTWLCPTCGNLDLGDIDDKPHRVLFVINIPHPKTDKSIGFAPWSILPIINSEWLMINHGLWWGTPFQTKP